MELTKRFERSWIPVAIVFAALTARLFWLTAKNAVNVFYWDQWDFDDSTVFQDHSLWEIFRWQHGPHRFGVGGLLSALVEPWFHWNGRTEAILATALTAMAVLCALWLKRRLFGSVGLADVMIPMIMLTVGRWDPIWSNVNMANVLAPSLMLLYCIGWTCAHERMKYVLVVILNFLTMNTGYALLVGFLTPVLLLACYLADGGRNKGGRTYLACCLGLSLATLALFFTGYRVTFGSDCDIYAPKFSQYLWFVDLMFAPQFGFTGLGIVSKTVGALGLALTVGAAWYGWSRILLRRQISSLNVTIAVLSAVALMYCPPAAWGRTCDGLFTSHASRYTVYMQLGTLSLYFCSLAVHLPKLRVAPPAWLFVLVLPAVIMSRTDQVTMESIRDTKAAWRTCILAGKSINECDATAGFVYPYPERTHLQDKLDYLRGTQQNLFVDAPEFH